MTNFAKLHIFSRPDTDYPLSPKAMRRIIHLKAPGEFMPLILEAARKAKDVAWSPTLTVRNWKGSWRLDYQEIPEGEVGTGISSRKYKNRWALIHYTCDSDNHSWLGDGVHNNTVMLGAHGRSCDILTAIAKHVCEQYGYSAVLVPESYSNERQEYDTENGKWKTFKGFL